MVTIIAREGVLSMTDLFSYLLPYPASVLCLDSDPKLNFLVRLLVLLIVTALFDWFKKIIPHYWTEGVSYQFESWMSYVNTLIWFYSNCYYNRIGKEESKIWCHTLLPKLNVWNQSNDSNFLASNFQIFMTVYLHINSNISTIVKYFWLLFSSCSLSFYSSFACQEGLQSRVWAIPSSFLLKS